jgi:hypothetical protein
MEEQLRQGRAYNLILRAEEHIRRFIEYNLVTTRIPRAIQRKVTARSGALNPNWTIKDLLRRVDFADYKTLMFDSPNWALVFSHRIKDRKTVATRLMELNIYRRSVAHSRLLSEAEFMSLKANVDSVVRQLKLRRR